MKRDMNLVRQILLALEQAKTYDSPLENLIDEEPRYLINYHVLIMTEGNLIESIEIDQTFNSPGYFIPTRLTGEGHEFLEASRDENIWKRALSQIESKGGSLSLDRLKGLLLFLAKDKRGI